jgi:hypothetical protein
VRSARGSTRVNADASHPFGAGGAGAVPVGFVVVVGAGAVVIDVEVDEVEDVVVLWNVWRVLSPLHPVAKSATATKSAVLFNA